MSKRFIIFGLGQNVYKDGRSFKTLYYAKKVLELCEETITDELEIKEIEVESFEDLQQKLEKYKEALTKIANIDYRGNRSTESVIAFKALQNDEELE